MLQKLLLTASFTLLTLSVISAQDAAAPAPEKPKAWNIGAGMGMDFAQLLQINPKQGAGQNRLGAGGAITMFAKLKKDRLAWDNTGVWQFGVQRLGSGPLVNGESLPFQKAIDEFRLSSKVGYKATDSSRFFYAADVNLFSQLTPTYRGTTQYPGNFLTDITRTNATPLAQFFSPATITASIGIDFKPKNNKFSFFYSPFGSKFIIVADDAIARQGVHGNPVTKNASGTVIDFKNVDAQLGSLLKATYVNKFLEGKLTTTSTLLLFSNYLSNPQNIDVDWNNELAMTIVKGLQVSLTMNVFYDDNVRVQITDYDAPGGVSGTGKRVSFTQQLLLKYNVNF